MKKHAVLILGTAILALGLLFTACDPTGTGDDTGDDTGDTTTVTLAPPAWIQGTWTYTDSTGYETHSFTSDDVVYESNYGSTTNTTVYSETLADPVEESTDTVYSLESGYNKYEWTLQDNGTVQYKVYYDGSESTSLTKYLIPEDLVGIDGAVDIDESYAGASVWVVVEDDSGNELDSTEITVEAGTERYSYELYADASVTSYALYAVVDPDSTFGNADDMVFAHVDAPLGAIDGGSMSVDNDFPFAKISGQVTVSTTVPDAPDYWAVYLGAWDTDSPSGDPINYDMLQTTDGTQSYSWEILVNKDDYTDGEAYIMAMVEDASENTVESGVYGSNPVLLFAGGNHQFINITTSTP